MRLITRLLGSEAARASCIIALSRRWGRPPGVNEFPYSRGLRLLMAMLLGWVVVEVPILVVIGGFLLHVTWLQVLLAIVGLYAVWWVASTWASFIALPHAVRNGTLDLHVGTRAAMRIRLQDVDRVSREQRGWSDAIGPSISGHTVALPVGGQTSICVRLRQPAVLRRSRGRLVEATEIHIQVDDPGALRVALDRAIAAFGAPS